MDKREIHDIAHSAADKVVISERCKAIGVKLLSSREILQTALDFAAHARLPEDIVSSGLAKDMINQAKELSREVELTGEEAMRLEVTLLSAIEAIDKAAYVTAISYILDARRSLLDLMFQEVLTCECGEAKAIEEKLGKEALQKILAPKEGKRLWYLGEWWEEEYSTAECIVYQSADGIKRLYAFWDGARKVVPVKEEHRSNPGDYITVVDPGKTVFNEGETISRKVFEQENERVMALGEAPATGVRTTEMGTSGEPRAN